MYIIIESIGSDTRANCVAHGTFSNERYALAWGERNINHSEWHVTEIRGIDEEE